MRIRTTDFYDVFACLAQDCPDTCCANWCIPIDKQTRVQYRMLKTPLGQALRRALRGDHFKNKHGRCPFLTKENLCALILQTQSQALLGYVCQSYPRKVSQYGAYRQISMSVSCPRAAQLTLASEALRFVVRESDEMPALNALDPHRFAALLQMRDACIACVQTDASFAEKVRALLLAAGVPARRDAQTKERMRMRRLFLRMQWSDRSMKEELRALRTQEHSYQALEKAYPQWQHDLTNLLVYCLDRYLLEAADDGNAAGRVCMCVAWCRMLYELACARCARQGAFSKEDMQRLVVRFARQTEHCDHNLRLLLRHAHRVI